MEASLRNNQLDRDYNAARWCTDEAASDRIFVAANSQDHLTEAYLGILFEIGCKAFPIDRSSSMDFVVAMGEASHETKRKL